MDIKDRKVNLIEKWGNLDLYECMLQELMEVQEKSAEMLKLVLDLTNRLRHLEFLADPVQAGYEDADTFLSDIRKEKP